MAHKPARRDVLKASAAFAAVAAMGGVSCVEIASAAPIQVPTIDKLKVRCIVDSASDIFFRPQEASGVKTEPGRSADSRRPLHSEWGLCCCSSRSVPARRELCSSTTAGRLKPSTGTWTSFVSIRVGSILLS